MKRAREKKNKNNNKFSFGCNERSPLEKTW